MVCTKGLKVMSRPNRHVGAIDLFVQTLAVEIGRAIFGLHEPAGRVDAEEVQVVLDAAADEPALGVEAVGVQARRGARVGAQQRAAGPVGAGVTAVDVGQNVRSDEIANPRTGCPSRLHLGGADDANGRAATEHARISDVALQAAERAVAEDAEHPRRAGLPVITGTHRAEPAVATRLGVGADDAGARCGGIHATVGIPEAATGAAENVEARPARSHHDRRRSLGVGPSAEISSRGRSGECRKRGQSDH